MSLKLVMGMNDNMLTVEELVKSEIPCVGIDIELDGSSFKKVVTKCLH